MELQPLPVPETGRKLSNTCRALLEHLSGYLDDELERSLCQELEQHLSTCPDCRTLADTMRRTILLAHQYGRIHMPPDATLRILDHLQLDARRDPECAPDTGRP